MTVELARNRRLKALEKCKSDRLLVSAAEHPDDLCLPDPRSQAAQFIDALKNGTTIEQLEQETAWSKARIMAALYKVAKKTGVGIHRRDEELHIVWPETETRTYDVRPTVQLVDIPCHDRHGVAA